MGLFNRKATPAMSDAKEAAAIKARAYTDAELEAMPTAPAEASQFSCGAAYDLWRRWEDIRAAKRLAAEKAKLKQYEANDDAAKLAARSFKPDVSVKAFLAGDFLCVGEHEIPRRYIEDISVFAAGSAPHITYIPYCGHHASDATGGLIDITLVSGKRHLIRCSRHSIDAMFEAVTNAWKHGVAEKAA